MIALTIGTFDTPHLGHAKLFKFCESLGTVIVGVNSDGFIKQYKGKRPLFSYKERSKLIKNLGYKVIKNKSAGRQLIKRVKPDFLVIGSDWLRKDYLKQIDMTPNDLDKMGITLIYTPYTQGISSTLLKKKIYESHSHSHDAK